ncbi:hypothetical protein AB870_13055 [Pandoraea faecigallinarum]|uniref:Uncharacterized protein n=1 Tax=Pandoraea faecigallinarum TaxID=656179 RepID=A0A0H3WT77_9BURK|nr:hypothetical protein AB870_13055 [Pandoraea faecigallinarum]
MSRASVVTTHACRLATTDEHASRESRVPEPAGHGRRPVSRPAPRNWRRWWALFAILPFVTCVGGCGLLAAPCRVTSAGLKIIPGVGGALAVPTDACAAAID